ncbi:hypothetical protein PNEG_02320 [Pneumocystis murina B123]|uniref:CFEM domain-containing protein n=1 Tax=Pneumocystis murina (strain B123) TaxID=1069680 RepID=M7NQJ6_PNEMU|nr:hypothetical protein PNEG_02320 [Pneumocystis murina B123]EMR09371.1 hypothetical protein PNEG_02320 [Pneumocystis murina B123]
MLSPLIFVYFFIFIVSVSAKSHCVDHLADSQYLSDISKECYRSVIKTSSCRGIYDIKCICSSENYKLDIFSCILEKNRIDGYNMAVFFQETCKDLKNISKDCLEKKKKPVPEKTLSVAEQNVVFDPFLSIDDFMAQVRQEMEKDMAQKCIEQGNCKGRFDSTCSILYMFSTPQGSATKTASVKASQTDGSVLLNFASTDLGLFSSFSNLIKLFIAVISLMFLSIVF